MSARGGASILTLARAGALVAALRRRPGRRLRIVLANGLFDLLHVGHLRYLGAARRLGDLLIVALNNDRSARRLRGAGRPLVPARERARLLAAVRGVDVVVPFGGLTVDTVLRRLRPDVHCKGTDYTPGSVPERQVVLSYGGRVMIAGDPKRHASTALIQRIGRVRRRGSRRGGAR